jgi:C4-dicarboxylate-specific signal transduction histidine kinase
MTPESPPRAIARPSILRVVAIILTLAIFIVDTLTDLEIAVAVFYVAVVLVSVSFSRRRGVMLVSAGCMALTVLSFLLTRAGSRDAGLINCGISISAIGVTAYLALKFESAEVAVHEARAQLVQIARVTSLGELATSIAHEVNQPLAAVVASANACRRWLAGEPPNLDKAKHAAERIVSEANRASDVIRRVRGLARRAPPKKDWLSVNDTMLEVIALTRGEIERNRIALRSDLAEGLPQIFGDRIQLQQVMLNLIVNAIDALRAVKAGPRDLIIESRAQDANGVVVAVRDTGAGVAPDKLALLFEAFYTTRSDGIGMGLTISRSIVEAHGGRIWATANSPRGAAFQFTLPLSED